LADSLAPKTTYLLEAISEVGDATDNHTVTANEAIRYQVTNTVPGRLDPVHSSARAGDNREIQLQRAALTVMAVVARWRMWNLVPLPPPVCIENLIRFECLTESHNVGDDGCAPMLLSGAIGLALQVEEPA